MSHGAKQSHCSTGSYKGSCHVGGHRSHPANSQIFNYSGSNKVHLVDNFRAPSVHGGSGGKGISISKNLSFSQGSSHWSVHSGHGKNFSTSGNQSGWKKSGVFCVNEKETMQMLNDRLASYLEKVHSLENQNTQLERNIREWYDRNQPSASPDFSNFLKTIQELQYQVFISTVENSRALLQIGNARLEVDDFKNKYEMELKLRTNVETDVSGLRSVLEGLNREICNLETRVQNLQEELLQMKRNHEEEVNSLQAQLGQRVNVEVDAAPSVDLNQTLSEIRQQYENLMERNLKEVENMFRQRTEDLNRQVASGSEQLQSVQTEVIDLKRNAQTLEIELQSQLGMKCALEGTLAEIESGYSSQLSQLQGLINNIESQLGQIRSDLEHQNHEYKILMDQKTHLEMEINTYKCLLDRLDLSAQEHNFQESKDSSHHVSNNTMQHNKS